MRKLALCSLILLGCSGDPDGRRETFATGTADEAGTGTSESDATTAATDTSTDEATDTGEADSTSTDTDTGTDTGSDTGSETGEPSCTRRRYSFNRVNDSWSSVALDQAWTGPDAPPCSVEVAAAVNISAWSTLLVVGLDEMVYRRVDGVWQAPVPWSDSFAALVGTTPLAGAYQLDLEDPDLATVYWVTEANDALVYSFNQNGGAVLVEVVALVDAPPPGAPQGSEDPRWAFALIDAALAPDPEWLVWYMNYLDGYQYRYNAGNEWVQEPQGVNELFGTGQGEEPNPASIRAAWGDLEMERIYFVD